jgi:predicted glycogen debranching enzyme
MFIEFGRETAGRLELSQSLEWLVTNGIGGFASGTMANLNTRRYHGLLVAALDPPLGRTVLLAKLDETVAYDGRQYPLFSNRWGGGVIDPHGYQQIESFRLEGTIPTWRFACADALLEKQIWMEQGANTTYSIYRLCRASGPLTLTLKALANYRDYHGLTRANGWQMDVAPMPRGLKITAFDGATPFYIYSDTAGITLSHDWYNGFDLAIEHERGLDGVEDLLHSATLQAMLSPGDTLTVAASTEEKPDLNGLTALGRQHHHEQQTLAQSPLNSESSSDWITQLTLAADQFIVSRPLTGEPDGRTIIAGYHWFGDWGRDTMISLPGLSLTTGRPDVAGAILQTFARYVDHGMLPNTFPDSGTTPEYNTVDATLWYFEAIRAYHADTGDSKLLEQLFPVLADIIHWHQQGTRYQIHVDPDDGLLYAGEAGVQLTWMDARIGDWVVTPRTGKPVEVNALWYNALLTMAGFARRLGKPSRDYQTAATRVRNGFIRFWNDRLGYCYDVIDGPDGDDASLRPSQILAVSLPETPLTPAQQRGVVECCARYLLTSHGLRSLTPEHPAYAGHYLGNPVQRDSVYHQGTVWGWLLGPFSLAHLRVYKDPRQALDFLHPLANQLKAAGLGTLSEIYDGDAPMNPRGCIAQAWTVAETLRAWRQIKNEADRSARSKPRDVN